MRSASAGAGKTTVLVERLIQICTRKDNPIDLDRIIAMTFTDAAAAEMKKRLSVSLSEQLQKEDSDKNRIQKQLVLLSTAQISTIHSFCLSIIKKYYDEGSTILTYPHGATGAWWMDNDMYQTDDKLSGNLVIGEGHKHIEEIDIFFKNLYFPCNCSSYALKSSSNLPVIAD